MNGAYIKMHNMHVNFYKFLYLCKINGMVVVFPILKLLTMKVIFEYSLLRHECFEARFCFFFKRS